jgi:hypothetical protein
MSTLERRSAMRFGAAIAGFVLAAGGLCPSAFAQGYGIGRPASEAEIRGWDIDVRGDGLGLPGGSGSAEQGKGVYERNCAGCHGMKGEGKPADRLVGGHGTLKAAAPVKTVGSFWPYAPTLFDYIRRAMPYDRPGSLTDDEVYALSAYLLHLNGIVPANAILDAAALRKVEMPNRHGFTADPRPDIANFPCRNDCR